MARMYDVNTVNAAMMQAAEICREKLPEGDKLKKVLACFAGMESVEAEPVVHAEWLLCGSDDYDAGMYYCSACKDERYFGDEVNTSEEAEKYCHYCPNCGARMDGGAE